MELSDIRLALRRYWPVAILALAVWLAIGAAIGVLPADRYRTGATVLATPADPTAGDAIQVASFEIPTIVARVGSRSFRDSVRAEVPASEADADVSVGATWQPGTGIISVNAEGESASAVAAWATAAARGIVVATDGGPLDLEVLDPALPPDGPFSPKPVASLFGAAVAGFLSAVLATLVVYRMRRVFDLDDEIRRRLGIPVVGHLPSIPRRSRRIPMTELLTESDDYADALQRLRTSVELAMLDLAPADRTLAVGSWQSGEGKSTVTASLGTAMARSGRQVALVDADLRHPTQHLKLGEPFGEGLAEADRTDPSRLFRRTREPKLSFLAAGVPDRHPSDIIAANLPQIVHEQAMSNHVVLVDSPPIHGIPETPMILVVAQRMLLVVDASSTKLPELERAVAEIHSSGVQIVGVVVNRVRRHRTAYGSYRYRPYLRVRDEAEELPPEPADDVEQASRSGETEGPPVLAPSPPPEPRRY